MTVLIVTLLVLQRFSLPVGGGVPVVLPVAVILLALGMRRGAFTVDPYGAVLYAIGIGAAILATLFGIGLGHEASLASVALLIVTYLILLVRTADRSAVVRDRVLSNFVNIMAGAGAVGLVQAGVQQIGLGYRDWLSVVVPQQFLVSGFNTGDPLYWGSHIIRSNAVFFLEPSILSMCLGLAAVTAAYLRRPAWVTGLIVVAILPTVALTGILIIAVAAFQALLQGRIHVTARLGIPILIMALFGTMVPNGARLVSRLSEIQSSGSSGNSRVIAPYEVLIPDWSQHAQALLIGNGAGSATEAVKASGIPALVTATIPKALYEYGVIAGLLLLVALVLAMWRGGLRHPWGFGLMVVFFAVNGSLLVPFEVLITLVFLRLIPATSTVRQAVSTDGWRDGQPAGPLAVLPG